MSATFDHDVVVVGGGPAGSSTALHLVRREGIRPSRVAILDKATFPRDKPCAGAVSQLGVDVLRDVGIAIDVPSVAMNGVRILAHGAVGETEYPMGVVIRRTEFDAHLLEASRHDGVCVFDGEGLTGITRLPDTRGFVLTTTKGRAIRARLVAAADGAGSTTRKLLGLREPDRKGHLYVLDTEPLLTDQGVRRGLLDFDLSILEEGLEGYYWDFPTVLGGALAVSRGIYHANFTRPDARSGESLKVVLGRALAKRGVDITKTKLRPFSTRPFVPGSTAWVRGVVLVGEAYGIDQTTGEGIAQAIEMGRFAARHLAAAVRSGDDRFEGYGRDVRSSTAGRHLLQSAWLARRVYAERGRFLQRYLLTSDYAREAGVRWYRGETLSLAVQLRLGLGLARSLFS